MKINRVLVTGGAGFIGSYSVDLLLKAGMEVVVLDNLSSGLLTNLELQHPNLEFIEGDILELPLVVDLLKECDAVLHLAAIASVPLSIENPIYTFQVNTQGLLHILEAIRQLSKPIRLVYASSAAVYGDEALLPCNDEAMLHSVPLSPYALQKMDDEAYAGLYKRLHAIDSLGLRYFNVYGKGQDPNSPYSGVISRFLAAYQAKNELVIFGDGKQTRDFIHVSDVAAANLKALVSDYTGALNIATGKPESLLDLVRYIEEAFGAKIACRHEIARSGDIRESYGTTAKASKQIDFTAQTPLQAGVKTIL